MLLSHQRILTREPLFVGKAAVLQGASFVVRTSYIVLHARIYLFLLEREERVLRRLNRLDKMWSCSLYANCVFVCVSKPLIETCNIACRCRAHRSHQKVGFDTASRILNPVYYGGDEGLAAMLKEMQQKSVQFVVAGRVANPSVGDGKFLTLESDLAVPKGYQNMFVSLSEDEFRLDLSSSMLRSKAKAKEKAAGAGGTGEKKSAIKSSL